MRFSLSRLFNVTIPSLPSGPADPTGKYKLFVLTCLLTTLFALGYGVMSYFIGFREGLYTMLFSVLVFSLCIYLLRFIRLRYLSLFLSLYIILINGILVYYSGGIVTSPVSPWIVLTAPIVLLLTDTKTALWVLSLCLLFIIGFFFAKDAGYPFPFSYPSEYDLVFWALSYVGLVSIFFLIAYTFESLKNQALDSLVMKQEELEQEQGRSEKLLLNILPQGIADELKKTGRSEARLHQNVSVLFADVKGFTTLADGLSPQVLVRLLDAYFKRIDGIIEKHGLEKIKTIGDSYLAACGVPDTNIATVENVIDAALEIQTSNASFGADQRSRGLPYFDFRVGVHTGTVVAGVVGEKKYGYDIWGDTVNIAARIEQNSEPGRVNISQSTYERIKGHFRCQARGKIHAKNKGAIEMYWVLERYGGPTP